MCAGRYDPTEFGPVGSGKMIDRRLFLGGAASMLASRACAAAGSLANRPLDVAYINCRVWTGRGRTPITDAIGTVGSYIAVLGGGAVRARTTRQTQMIDLQGAFVLPGLTDCHTHFSMASFRLAQLELTGASTPAEFTSQIGKSARALMAGEWLQGGGWDADRWGGNLPTAAWVDAVTPNTPVALYRYDLHILLLNSVAMKLVGLNANSPDIAGGVIVRDANGLPTGILKDAAKDFYLARIPRPTEAQTDAAVKKGIQYGLSKGITQVHCTEITWDTHHSLRRLRARGEPGMRFYSYNPLKDWEQTAKLVRDEGRGDDWVRWGACKTVFDGSLGSRTALFYEHYLDDPTTRGIIVTKPSDLREWMAGADRAGLQVAAHAIGDEANDTVLDTMAELARTLGPRDRRFRIEHAQSLSKAAIPRFAKQGVIASVQPYHAVDDGRWAVKRIGEERLTRTYAFHDLIASGAHVCMGSDWPVAPLDPLTGLKAAVLRETLDGKNPGGWFPNQRVSLMQALAGYTREAAYAGFTENRTGAIAPSCLADLVVMDRDLFAIDPETITDAKVLRTIVGGVQRFG
ncbi:MAG: amidohydrolase [Sphingomonadales bacterium]|nr:amidohydrolase [Sphingomonadales bacterium]